MALRLYLGCYSGAWPRCGVQVEGKETWEVKTEDINIFHNVLKTQKNHRAFSICEKLLCGGEKTARSTPGVISRILSQAREDDVRGKGLNGGVGQQMCDKKYLTFL